jgi:pentatricopeptide repeat protein
MYPIRSATLSQILWSRQRPIFAKWEEAVLPEQPIIISCKHEPKTAHLRRHGKAYGKASKKRKSWVPEAETTGPIGASVLSYIGDTRARDTRSSEIAMMLFPSSRFFSTANRKSGKPSRRLDDKIIDDNEPQNIVLKLKDTNAHPIGSISPEKIKEAEDALEYWVSTSATIRRPRRKRRQNNIYHDRHSEEYRKCFENAKSIFSRLVLEQKFHDDDHGIAKYSDEQEQQNESNEHFSDEHFSDEHFSNEHFSDGLYFVRSFLLNRVVDCWRIGWRDGRLDVTPNEMIAWVEDMNNSRSDLTLSDNRTLTMIVDGICLRGDPYEAPLLAQWLLDRRLGQAYQDEDDTTLRPDTIFFTNVIRSWAKSGRVEAPEMADGLLQMMHELYSKSGWIESAPNAFSYAATMEAWSKDQHNPDSIKRIEALLEEMKNSNLMQVVPDRVTYQYVLNAWANSKSATGAEKAYDVLQEMIALYEAGNVLVAPNTSNFSRVMLALAQNGNDEKVESVLEQLQDLYSKTGDPNLEPTDECWKACIIAKAKTGGVAEAQGMLDELVKRALSKGNSYLMPRRSYFVDTLVAWTKTKDQKMAAEMSQKVLNRMIELARRDDSYRSLQPDAKSYEKVILAWSRSRQRSAPERIDSLLREMERQCDVGDDRMKPSLAGYTNLMLAWQRSRRNESTDEIQQIFDSLQIQCTTIGKEHLRPDRYIFGILIDSWARRKDLEKAESTFEDMMKEWRNGNSDARPDIQIFHKILEAHSKGNQNHGNAVKKCEYYFSLMKEVGLPTTILSYSYLIDALSSNKSAGTKDITRASAVLDELLESVRKGTLFPPKYREYRQFLLTISNSCIPRRNQQAKEVLASLSRAVGPIPKELLPP